MLMENIETYWAIANKTIAIINILIEGWLFYRFVKPFINRKSYCVGISYSLAMLVFYLVPQEMTYPYLLGIFVAWITMCLTERKKIKQKIFLAISMYLIRWMVYGVTLVLRDIMFALFINTPYMLKEPVKQLIAYIVVELIYYGVAIVVMWLVIKLIHKVYVNKKEDISGKELILLFATLLTVMVGYFTFNFFSNVYVEDTGNYVWNIHPGYTFLRVIYQIVSFAAILIAVIIYQRIKEKQREENVNLLLAEQIENTKQHISEVEKLYGDIRALKHDMGNHISVLENLFEKKEAEEFEKYLTGLKSTYSESVEGIKTGRGNVLYLLSKALSKKKVRLSKVPKEIVRVLALTFGFSILNCCFVIVLSMEIGSSRSLIMCVSIIIAIVLTYYFMLYMMERFNYLARKRHEDEIKWSAGELCKKRMSHYISMVLKMAL